VGAFLLPSDRPGFPASQSRRSDRKICAKRSTLHGAQAGPLAVAEIAAQNAGLEVPGADERPRLGPAYPLGGRNQKAGLAQDDIGADVPHHATGDLSGEPGAVDRAALAVVVVVCWEQDPPDDVCWLTTAKEHFDLINLCSREFTLVGLQPGV